MNPVNIELSERIRNELPDIEYALQRALQIWPKAKIAAADQDIYLSAIALNLHGFYSGLERLFELIARHIDRTAPTGENWHRDLLQQIARDVPNVRPAVLDSDSALALDEFRRFRHLVRNIYTMNLVPSRMALLIEAAPDLWPTVKAELLAFADFLADLGLSD